MKAEILNNLDHPGELEKIYRSDKATFRRYFNQLYPEIADKPIASYWHERLNYSAGQVSWCNGKELLVVLLCVAIAGVLAKLPAIAGIDAEFFYSRNVGFIVFPLLSYYFVRRNQLPVAKTAALGGIFLVCLLYINLLPDLRNSDTIILASIHLQLILWGGLLYAFSAGSSASNTRLNFLKFNGDLLVMCALIGISGMLMSMITIGLFRLAGFNIEEFYFKNVGVVGLAAIPIVATYLTQVNPQLVGKVSPVIARIFSPLVLVMLSVYLFTILWSGKDPYSDRDFLIVFNALLVGVMALIFFSLSGSSGTRFEVWVLLLLSILTIVVNGIALSAIIFRISTLGITPNRAAVMGANLLILLHLLRVSWTLMQVVLNKGGLDDVKQAIATYIPVYIAWGVVVTFLFPWIFGW